MESSEKRDLLHKPVAIFTEIGKISPSAETLEVREKLLQSIRKKVSRINVGATKSPERGIISSE